MKEFKEDFCRFMALMKYACRQRGIDKPIIDLGEMVNAWQLYQDYKEELSNGRSKHNSGENQQGC